MIRPAEERDAPGIAAVHVSAWQRAYRGIVPDEVLDGMSVLRRAEAWRTLLTGDDSFTLVAEEGGAVAGFCTVAVPSRDDDAGQLTAEVAAIYVDPDRWRAGIGRTLLQAALQELAAGGWREVRLGVRLQPRSST